MKEKFWVIINAEIKGCGSFNTEVDAFDYAESVCRRNPGTEFVLMESKISFVYDGEELQSTIMQPNELDCKIKGERCENKS